MIERVTFHDSLASSHGVTPASLSASETDGGTFTTGS
jgi:hypothetical protein